MFGSSTIELPEEIVVDAERIFTVNESAFNNLFPILLLQESELHVLLGL